MRNVGIVSKLLGELSLISTAIEWNMTNRIFYFCLNGYSGEKRTVLDKQAIYKAARHLLAIKQLPLSVLIPVPTIPIFSSIILIILIHLFYTA